MTRLTFVECSGWDKAKRHRVSARVQERGQRSGAEGLNWKQRWQGMERDVEPGRRVCGPLWFVAGEQ